MFNPNVQDELRGPQPAEDEPLPLFDSSASSDSSRSSLASISPENEICFLSDEDDVEAVPLSSDDDVEDDSDDGTPLNKETLNENQSRFYISLMILYVKLFLWCNIELSTCNKIK